MLLRVAPILVNIDAMHQHGPNDMNRSIKRRRLRCRPPPRNTIAARADYYKLHMLKGARTYRRVGSSIMAILRCDGCQTCVKRCARGAAQCQTLRTCDTGTQRRSCDKTGSRTVIPSGAVAMRQKLQIFQQVAAYVLLNVNEVNDRGTHGVQLHARVMDLGQQKKFRGGVARALQLRKRCHLKQRLCIYK